MAAMPIRRLRAQHFVRAFEVDGVAASHRAYAMDMLAKRFSELDVSMHWALKELRSPP